MKEELYEQIQEIEQTHWWYVARRRIIFDWVLRILHDYPQPMILNIGCGTGYNIEQLQVHHYTNVTGLEYSPSALGFCQSRGLKRLMAADGTHPPFRDKSFDVVLALDLIEHIEDDRNCLRELARVLKPGGTLFIFTPAFNFLWGLQDEVSHHCRRYTATELRGKLIESGLTIRKLTYLNTFLFPLIWAGRFAVKLAGDRVNSVSENDLHPTWSNGVLMSIFSAERPLLRYLDLPFGVSLLCVARKPTSQNS